MNTNFNGIRELTAGDLDSVSGGSDTRGAVVGMVIQYLWDTISIADNLEKMVAKKQKSAPPPK